MYYDEPTRIMEIIQADHEEMEWMKPYLEIIESRVDNEKIREWSRRRWMEYLEKHQYKMTPDQEYYWENRIWSDTEWKKSEE